jgi:predicted AlkP superfamily phosphohydrolase/phosphomutase
MVAGMLTPPGSDRGCWPAEFRQHLADYSYDLDEPVPTDLSALCRRLEALAMGRARVTEAAFDRERFDLGMVVFTGPDRLFHRHYAEVCAPEDPAAIPPPAASYLRTLDGACERICAAFGEDAALIICSDHGFGPGPRQAFFVNRALKKAGLLAVRPAFSPYALNIMLFGLKKLLGKGKPLPVDWRRSAAYGFPLYMGWGGVFLNVRGEQPEGIVDTADVAGVAERVARALEDSGVTRWVKTRAELYDGPAAAELPHVVFEAEAGTVVSEGKGPGPLVAPYEDKRKLGEHTPQAIMGVAGGGVSAKMPASPGIADVAATAAALLGLDVRPLDGVPWVPIS